MSVFSDLIYTTIKNELKMMWFNRNIGFFPLKNGNLTHVLCNQVTPCLG